jgi:putative ABC transport system permease protein
MNIQPPKWADRFLTWYCNPDLLEEIQGDAHELYFDRVNREGKAAADRKYIWDVIRFCRWSNIRRLNTELHPEYLGILWNLNLKIAIRNAFRNKLTFSIKVFGLSVCLAFAFIVSAFVIQEFTFDRHHKDHDKIFRVGLKVGIHGVITNYAVSPFALRDALVEEIPEVEEAFRFKYAGKPIYTIDDKIFNEEQTLVACENFLKILTLDFIHGSNKALDEPNKVVLTQTTASKFFGNEDPINKSIDIGWTQLEVAAVVKDPPVNSHLQFDVLISWNTFDFNEDWDNINAYTYFKLNPDANFISVQPKIVELLINHREEIKGSVEHRGGNEITIEPIVENIADLHLTEFRDEDIAVKGNRTNLNILIVVILLFFITGLINFHNLSLAELTANLRKIGILRVFGGSSAKHGKVIITNTFLSVIITVPLTILLGYSALLAAKRYLMIEIEHSIFFSTWFTTELFTFAVVFIFSGKINSVVLAGANDIINSLKGKLTIRHHSFKAREILVAMQLSFSIMMLALITIIMDQFNYVTSVDKGFEDKNTIVVKLRSNEYTSALNFQEAIRKLNGVQTVDGGSFYLDNVETKEFFEVETEQGRKKMLVTYMNCGYEYLDVLKIKLVCGRNFMKEFTTDNYGAYLINETAAKQFGWKDPIGKRIWGPVGTDRDEGKIVGIIKDFNFASLHNKIEPLIIFPVSEGWGISYVYIKVSPIRPPDMIAKIEEAYTEIYPDLPYEWEYLDSKYASLYAEDYEVKNVFQVGLIISLIVSCLGIFGMSALLVILRAKEMGIRKVVGANQLQLFVLHIRTLLKFILIAAFIGGPLAYYLSNEWLNSFAYRISLNAWYYILPCLITILIVILTSAYHGLKSAYVNPADILKDE